MAKTSQPKKNKPRPKTAQLSKEIEAKPGSFSGLSVDAFLLLDENLNLLSINDAGQKMFGVSKAGVFGKCILDVIPDIKNTGIYKKYRHVLKTGKSIAAHLELGGRHLSVQLFQQGDALGIIVSDITERKRVEEALRESESRFRLLYERAPFGYQSLNKDGYFIEVNPAWLDTLGYSREEVIGRWFGDFLAPGYEEHFKKNFPRFKAAGEIHGVEFEMLRKDGSKVTVAFDGKIGYDEHGKFKQTHCILQDITERKRMEEALRSSERYFRSLIQNAFDATMVIGRDGTISYGSSSIEPPRGYKPEDVIGTNGFATVHPEDMPKAMNLYNELMQNPANLIRTEVRVRHKDGSWRIVEAIARNLLDDPIVGGIIVNYRDVTERKQAEEALRQSEQNYRVLFEGTLDGLFVVSAETGRIVLANLSAAKMFGFSSPEAMIGVYPINFVTPQNRNGVLRFVAEDVLRDLSEEGSRSDREVHEIRALANDGREIWLEIQGTPTEYQGKLAYLVSSRDITERKQAEEALRRSEEYFRALIENAQDAIVILNGDGTMRYGSPSIERIWGYKVEDWSDKNYFEFVHPDDMQNAAEAFARLLRNPGSRIYTEMHVRHKNGSIHVVEASGKNLLDNPSINGIVLNVRDITERKQAEEMLRESEVRFRELFENMSGGVAVYEAINEGQDFIFKDFNRAGERIEKTERRDVIGKSVLDVFPGVKDLGLFEVFRRVWRTGNPEHHPILLYKDERIVGWRENYVYKLPSGEIVSIYDDVTERKQAEEALRESEEKYRNLFNTAEVALFGSRIADGKILECNDLLAKLFGYDSREQCMVEHVTSEHYVDPSVRAQILTQMLENGKVENFEVQVTRRDGSPFWVSYSAHIYPERNFIEGAIVDITERKRAEEALRHERDNLLNTLNAMKDGVYIINQQNDIVFANPSTKEEFGPYEGKKCYEYFHDFKEPCSWCDSREICAGRIVRSEWFFPKTGKTYEVVHTPFREIDGNISKLSIIRDITERKRMEEALRKSEQTIRELAKASIRAHEEERQRAALEVHDRISQTLTGAFHQLQALETIPLRDAVAERLLSRASALLQECIGESRNIMKDLYSPVLSDFGVVAVIDEELDYFQEDTGCQARFHATCPNRLPRDVEVNAYRIFQEALMNIRKHAASAREVAVTLTCKNDVVSLQVVDNGPGFDVEAAMQSKRVGGLKGMQRRAELGGGTFEVASSPGQGTTVTVCLPYTSEPSAADAEKEDKKT